MIIEMLETSASSFFLYFCHASNIKDQDNKRSEYKEVNIQLLTKSQIHK